MTVTPGREDEIEIVANAIDLARFQHPEHPRERPRPFSEADRPDREYAIRMARAAITTYTRLAAKPPSDPDAMNERCVEEDARAKAADEGWQDISTAPKNGREVILQVKLRAGIRGKCLIGHYMPGGFCISDHPAIDAGWYFWNGCMFDRAAEPLLWMPLPDSTTGEPKR